MAIVSVTVAELKDLLLRFSWERRDWPREDMQREFGALVLYLMQQAASVTTLVPAKRELDA